jgi:hypothetical protein
VKLGRSPEARGLLPRKAEPTVGAKPVVPSGEVYGVRQPSMVDAVLVRNDPGGGVALQQPRELRARVAHSVPEEFFRDVVLDTRLGDPLGGAQYRVAIETNPTVLYADITLSAPEYMYSRSEAIDEMVLRRITADIAARVEEELRRKLRATMGRAREPNAR